MSLTKRNVSPFHRNSDFFKNNNFFSVLCTLFLVYNIDPRLPFFADHVPQLIVLCSKFEIFAKVEEENTKMIFFLTAT